MENKVDKIGVIIPLPLKSDGTQAQASQIATMFDIDEIEIIDNVDGKEIDITDIEENSDNNEENKDTDNCEDKDDISSSYRCWISSCVSNTLYSCKVSSTDFVSSSSYE